MYFSSRLFLLLAMFSSFFTLAQKGFANTTMHVQVANVGSNLSLITEKESRELADLKEKAKEKGFAVPSTQVARLAELTLKTSMFADTEVDQAEIAESVQNSYDAVVAQASADWEKAHAEGENRFEGVSLVGITKSGIKVRFSSDTPQAQIEKVRAAVNSRLLAAAKGGVCSVYESAIEMRLICLNLEYLRVGESLQNEVKKISNVMKGHDASTGPMSCGPSGCGTMGDGHKVRQLDALATKAVLTGKKINVTETRRYSDRAVLEEIDASQIESLL